MRFDEVRRQITEEWLELPLANRRTEEQAITFATKAAKRHGFESNRDPLNLIMRWLRPHIPD